MYFLYTIGQRENQGSNDGVVGSHSVGNSLLVGVPGMALVGLKIRLELQIGMLST